VDGQASAPATSTDPVEDVLGLLRARGGRATPARRLLLAALLQPGHHSAEQIAASVHARAPDVHLTTIYRNLDELERLHVIDRTYVSNSPATYHLASAAHGHLACETCGAILELPDDAFQGLADAAKAIHGFTISPSHFAIPGYCSRCQ